jgi:hypothetical protein
VTDSIEVRTRTWPVRAIGVLLVVQGLGILAIVVRDLVAAGISLPYLVSAETPAPDVLETIVLYTPLALLAGLCLLGGVGFVFLLRFGWITAMAAQGLTLLYCLYLYFFGAAPGFIYPIMVYTVLLVLYLNSSGVQTVFRARHGDI